MFLRLRAPGLSGLFVLVAVLAAGQSGCGLLWDVDSQGDDDQPGTSAAPTPTPTPRPSPSPTPTVVPTPTAGTDADFDGWTVAHGDCDDSDPFTYPGATDWCADSLDNDCDGFVNNRDDDGDGALAPGCGEDCDDSDPGISPFGSEGCRDGLDDDCDGDADCDDADCDFLGNCFEVNCTDGVDEDGDGLFDCDDPDCQELNPICPQTYSGDCCNPNGSGGCGDNHANECVCGFDNNCCTGPAGWDAICVNTYTYECDGGCVPEVCDDGVDNDSDGRTDCDDPNCWEQAECHEQQCSDGVDEDGDGQVDCADFDCVRDPACYEASCADGADNDGDGGADCFDLDCVADAACVTGYPGSCCSAHAGAGCGSGSIPIMQCVCSALPACCFRGWDAPWDSLCVDRYVSCGGNCP